MSASLIAFVALGGAAGAVSRYLVAVLTIKFLGQGFPLSTLLVNIGGSFAMGLLVGSGVQRIELTDELRAIAAVGFLGAFTTFSTFSLDAVDLWERGRPVLATAYVALSVIGSVSALIAGLALGRR